jgi:hypothetical protein
VAVLLVCEVIGYHGVSISAASIQIANVTVVC